MTTKKKRTRAEAKKLMWEYYRDNKRALPHNVKEFRDEILNSLMTGKTAAQAFAGSMDVR
jgi:hypothetical protein